MELTRECNLKPVSFEKYKELTKSQQAIYDLLVRKVTAGEVLTTDDIVEIYLSVEPRYHRVWSIEGAGRSDYQAISTTGLTKANARPRAIQWFKNNLAACIIKGKILAIPVIEDM